VTLWANGSIQRWRAPGGADRGAIVRRFLLDVLAYVIPFAIVGVILLWHNYARFGSIFDNGYGGETFSTPFLVGLYGQLLSSGKSVFLYSPVIALALFTFRPFFKRWAPEALVFAGIIAVNILYYSPWWAWYGGWAWGPRFLVPVIPFFMLMIGPALENRRMAIFTFAVLFPLGIFVNVLGVWVDFNAYMREIYAGDFANEVKYQFLPWLSPLVGHVYYLLAGKAIAIDSFRLAGRGFSPEFAAVAPWGAIFLSLLSAVGLGCCLAKHEPRLEAGLTLRTSRR
jgi:hypothetical protein